LYSIGGFKLPFLVVGSIGLAVAVAMVFLLPDLRQTMEEKVNNNDDERSPLLEDKAEKKKELTFKEVLKVKKAFKMTINPKSGCIYSNRQFTCPT